MNSSKKYILAIDQGTTSSRAFIYDRETRVAGKSQQEFTQLYPAPGWVEHDPEEIWNTTKEVIEKSIENAGITTAKIAAIGITNQRETTVIWDKESGKPIHNAIVWQCRRTGDICRELRENGLEEKFREKTGLLLDPYFSGTKIKWLLDNIPGARHKAREDKLLFGTIDSWLIWKLTGGKQHITDYTNASRTLLYNINELRWDQELLDILDIPANILPEVRASSEIYGTTDGDGFLKKEIPIAGIAGDQQAATFAQGCYDKGMTKITYGTGAFLVMNTGPKPVKSKHGLLTTIAWGYDGKIEYALEGSIFNAGAIIQWLCEEMKLIEEVADSEYFARKVEDTDGVYFIPAFTGLGAPHWEPEAKATITGMTRGTNKNHIIRAALEAIAYQSRDVIKAMVDDSEIDLSLVKVDGGAAQNSFILQFLADITGIDVEKPADTETTVAGSAFLAGLAVDFWSDREEIQEKLETENIYEPRLNEQERKKLVLGWETALGKVLI